MKTSGDKEHIVRLLKSYATNPSTEEMLYLVAETSGMLDACKWLAQQRSANDREALDWLHETSHDHKVDPLKFLSEIQHVLSLFTPIQATDTSLYALLDLELGASREAIKQRYRHLCRRYHPDTALNTNEQHTQTFINITQAYHTLLSREETKQPPSQTATNHQWRRQSLQEDRNALKRKNILWFSILAIVLAGISLMAAQTYENHVMMAGLRNKGTAFVPPHKNLATAEETSGKQTLVIQERADFASSTEKITDPSPSAAETTITLSAGTEKLAVAKVTASSQTESRPDTQTTNIPPSIPQESVPLWKETAVPTIPVSHTTEQRLPTQTALNTTIEQTAYNSGSQHSATKRPPASTNSPLEYPPDKPAGAQQPKPVSKESLETLAKAQQVPTLRHQDTAQRIPPQSAHAEQPLPPRPSLEEQTQKKIDTFLQEYTTAYQQKNLLAFSRFFALDATENGKSLKDILTVYTQLFETTNSLRLAISLLNWQQDKTMLRLRGRFTIALMYKDGKKTQGRGAIDFQLADDHGKWQIKTLTYAFDE